MPKQVHDLWKRGLTPATLGEKVAFSLLETTWESSRKGADDSDRGTYLTMIPGTDLQISAPYGWHSMEKADRQALAAYRVIAKAIDAIAMGTEPFPDGG